MLFLSKTVQCTHVPVIGEWKLNFLMEIVIQDEVTTSETRSEVGSIQRGARHQGAEPFILDTSCELLNAIRHVLLVPAPTGKQQTYVIVVVVCG